MTVKNIARVRESNAIKNSRRLIPGLISDKSGSVITGFALVAIPLILAIGIAIDFGRAVHTRTAMQLAADAAVVAAAVSDLTDSEKIEIATTRFQQSVESSVSAKLTTPPTPVVTAKDGVVTLSANAGVKTMLMQLVQDEVDVGVLAKAATVSGGPICILALNPTVASGFDLSGTSFVNAPDCGAQVNSNNGLSVTQNGNADAIMAGICTAGDYSGTISTTPKTACPTVDDPLRVSMINAIAPIKNNPCDYTYNNSLKKTVTLSPGLHCGTIQLSSGANVTMSPGVYYLFDSDLIVGSNSTLTGDDVTIVFFGGTMGSFSFESGSDVNLTASKTGSFAGLLFVQDPDSLSIWQESTLIGGGVLELTGTIYMPMDVIRITGNGQISQNSPQLAIIADMVSMEGNGELNITMGSDYVSAGLPPVHGLTTAGRARLVQ